MNETETHLWLLGWFGNKGTVPGDDVAAQIQVNYFDVGLIDSMGVIELIGDVEEHFAIAFEHTHFQDRRFATIGGLGEIVDELRQ